MPVAPPPVVLYAAVGASARAPQGSANVAHSDSSWLWLLLAAAMLVGAGFLLCGALIAKALRSQAQGEVLGVPFVQRWLRERMAPSETVAQARLAAASASDPPVPGSSELTADRGYLVGDAAAASTRPGLAADARQSGHMSLVAVSVMGEGHVVEGTTREDAYAVAVDGHGCWVLAVADGVSGTTNSHLAADAAVNLAVGSVNARTRWQDVPRIVGSQLPTAIDIGESGGVLERRLLGDKQVAGSPTPKATLSMVRVMRTAEGLLQVDVAAVGNTSVLSISTSGDVVELLELRERSDGSTESLPSRDPVWQTGQATLSATDCLVLCSDGFERLYAENDELFHRIVFADDSPWDRLSQLVELMTRPAQGEYDDRTVAVLRAESVTA